MTKTIAVLLDGPVANDGRVRRIITSLSQFHKIHLYYHNGKNNDNQFFHDNVVLHTFTADSGWIKTNIRFHARFSELKEALLTSSVIYDFVYCNDYPLLQTAVSYKKQHLATQLIYDSHEIYMETVNQFFPTKGWKQIYGKPLIGFNKVTHKKRERKLISLVDKVITVCDSFKSYLEKEYAISDVLVVKNCPDLDVLPERNDSLRKLLGLTNHETILLYQGHLNPGRGIEKIIQAAPLFKKNVHVVIIGDGPKRDEFEQLSRVSGNKNVHFTGSIPFDELLNYTASADLGLLLIQPINRSKELTLPNKIFEYMAAGLPIVSNHLPEASQIIKDCECGYIIDDSSPEKIAESIEDIALTNALEVMGNNGQRCVREKYNWKQEVSRLLMIFE